MLGIIEIFDNISREKYGDDFLGLCVDRKRVILEYIDTKYKMCLRGE